MASARNRMRKTKGRRIRAFALRSVARALIDGSVADLNLLAMARHIGVSQWTLRYHFGTFPELFRSAVLHVVDQAERELVFSWPRHESVMDAIRYYAASLRNAVMSAPYRDMIFLILRHGGTHPWLREVYDRRIVGRACADLAESVLTVSERRGVPVLFKEGEARRFHRRVETEFALRGLLSPLEDLSDDDSEAVMSRIVREAFVGTYSFEWQADAA